jgi:pyruvate formate lyase activating enzyme
VNTNNEHNSQSTNVVKPVYSITPFTLLDYPDKTACILWFAGCNMRCVYCYNPDIVLGKGKFSFESVLQFLKTRKGLLDGVVFSGGECTLHPNIIFLIKEIKKMGMNIKIDTNGSKPNVLRKLIDEKLIDYLALDFKALNRKYYATTKSHLFNQFKKSLDLLVESKIAFEVRTTLHSNLINQEDIKDMVAVLEDADYTGRYYLQNYMNDVETIGNINNSAKMHIDLTILNSKLNIIFRN